MYILSTPIPYINGNPHLGHLLEAVFNDTIARFKRRQLMQEIVFSTGYDQHGLKIFRKAKETNLLPIDYVNQQTTEFKKLWERFEISSNREVATSSPEHQVVCQIFWQKLVERGFIYSKTYQGLYCVGDESFVSEGQLRANGMCPNHDEYPIKMEETNYFFSLSKFSDQISEYLRSSDIKPDHIRKEWLNFVENGLEDISISREKKNIPWGVPVPGDDKQVMYVWFEALINYLTALVNPENIDKYLEFPHLQSEVSQEIWEDIQSSLPINMVYLGKDIAKFHLVVWPAMLVAANLPLTQTSLVHGFINDSTGRKMSKSLGNGISPWDLVENFGVDGTRFLILMEVNPFLDTSFDWQKMLNSYNANLSNNLGNLVVRTSNLIEKYLDGQVDLDFSQKDLQSGINLQKVYTFLLEYNPQLAIQELISQATLLNQFLEEKKPWILAKELEKNFSAIKEILSESAAVMREIGKALSIFLPASGDEIYQIFSNSRISKAPALFPRIED